MFKPSRPEWMAATAAPLVLRSPKPPLADWVNVSTFESNTQLSMLVPVVVSTYRPPLRLFRKLQAKAWAFREQRNAGPTCTQGCAEHTKAICAAAKTCLQPAMMARDACHT
jgi:hypothetical protein